MSNLLAYFAFALFFRAASASYGAPIREDDGPLEAGLRTHMTPARRRLVLAHAICGIAAWLVFAPIAIITARYFKYKMKDVDGRRWFRIHFIFNGLTVLTTFATFILGYYATVPGSQYQFKNPHTQIGTAIFGATLLQASIGITHHYFLKKYIRNKDGRTPLHNKIHIILGWLTWGLAVSNIPVGMVLYGCASYLFIVYGVFTGGLLLTILVLEAVWGKNHGGPDADDGMSFLGKDEESSFDQRTTPYGTRGRLDSIPGGQMEEKPKKSKVKSIKKKKSKGKGQESPPPQGLTELEPVPLDD